MSSLGPLVPLGEVISVRKERVGSPDGAGLPVRGVSRTEGVIEPKQAPSADLSKYLRVERGDIAFNPYRANIGSLALFDRPAVVSPSYIVFASDSTRALPEFILGFLLSRAGLRQIQDQSRGSVRQALPAEGLQRILIPLPSLEEQARVARLLAAVKRSEREGASRASDTETLRHALRRHLLGEGLDASLMPLGELGTFARGGSFPRKEQGRTSGDYPVFKVADMNEPGNERLLQEPTNWVTEEQKLRLKMRLWPPGTVVFARVGAALEGDRRRILATESILDDNMLGISPNHELARPYFLMLCLEQIGMAGMAQHGAVPSINAKLISGVKVPIPNLSEQDRVVAAFDAFDAYEQALIHHRGRINHLYDALSQAAYSRSFEWRESDSLPSDLSEEAAV